MVNKLALKKPVLIMLYGYPGAGKSFFSRQMAESINAAHVSSDRIRGELFEEPRYNKEEDDIVTHLMDYMTEEFLNAGVGVIYDVNSSRMAQRRLLRDLARRSKAASALVWLQIDLETAFNRSHSRDGRKADDKYATELDRTTFEQIVGRMQNPQAVEDYVVISGKHTFNAQRSGVIKKLYELNVVEINELSGQVIKPGLVNLVPNPLSGRVDESRRNIVIR